MIYLIAIDDNNDNHHLSSIIHHPIINHSNHSNLLPTILHHPSSCRTKSRKRRKSKSTPKNASTNCCFTRCRSYRQKVNTNLSRLRSQLPWNPSGNRKNPSTRHEASWSLTLRPWKWETFPQKGRRLFVFLSTIHVSGDTYCWWKKSCTTWDV